MKAVLVIAILCLFAITFAQTQKLRRPTCGGEGQRKCPPWRSNSTGFLDFYRRQTLPNRKSAGDKPTLKIKPVIRASGKPSKYSGWLDFYNRQRTGRPTRKGSKQGSRRGSRKESRRGSHRGSRRGSRRAARKN
jgi:hypothetical protein